MDKIVSLIQQAQRVAVNFPGTFSPEMIKAAQAEAAEIERQMETLVQQLNSLRISRPMGGSHE